MRTWKKSTFFCFWAILLFIIVAITGCSKKDNTSTNSNNSVDNNPELVGYWKGDSVSFGLDENGFLWFGGFKTMGVAFDGDNGWWRTENNRLIFEKIFSEDIVMEYKLFGNTLTISSAPSRLVGTYTKE
jgi:hypothetical protein